MGLISRTRTLVALQMALAFALLLTLSCGGAAGEGEGAGSTNARSPRPLPTTAPVAPEAAERGDTTEPASSAPPIIAQITPNEFRALPALSNDGLRLAVAVNPAFSGLSGPELVVVVGVEGAKVNAVYRVSEELAEINLLLDEGGFFTLSEVAVFWPGGMDPPVVEGEGFAGEIAYRDPSGPDNANHRGSLFEGPETLALSIRGARGGRDYRADVSYVPPTFRSIPRRCHASFMPATVRVFGAPGRDLLLVHETWGSGSGECAPFRLVLVDAASGERPSGQRIIEESDIPQQP